ncbi:MAG: hypothetical protein CL609_17150 [Anaerolineaceae bacterium]|nr:hypothetical protein [Anaerolineaceae bacterium]
MLTKIFKNLNLSTKLFLANSLLILLLSGFLTLSLYWQIRSSQQKIIQERLMDILTFSVPLIDGDYHSLIKEPQDETSSFYRVISLRLDSIQETSNIIEQIYTLRQDKDGKIVYIVDGSGENHFEVGAEYIHTSTLLMNGLSFIKSPVVEDKIYTDQFGTFLTGYAPIYDQFRNLDGVLGIDINVNSIISSEKRARRLAFLSFFVTIPFSLLLAAWFSKKITAPMKDLVEGATRVANGQFIERVPIHSHDELGILAYTFNHMTSKLQQTMQGLTLEINKQAQAHKLQDIVFRISQAAVSSSNLDELYQTIHKLLGELISVENFYIALHDSVNDNLLFPYYIDEFDEPVSPVELGRGLTEYILRTGKPLLVTKPVYQELIKQGAVEIVGTPAYEWLGVPLKLNNQIIGVMATQSYSEEVHFTQENVDLFEFVSSQIAQTIERKRSEKELVVSRERYYRLFEESPISLWEEDLSKIKQTLDRYKEEGVIDFREFFINRPEVLVECAKNIKVLDVNKATVDLVKAKNKEDVINNFLTTFLDSSYEYFLEEMVLLSEGKTDFNLDGVKKTFDGKQIDVSMKWSVLSESHSDLSKVIISMIDITERRKSESKLTYLSTHDALTGLYNRSFFNEEMARLENEELYPISIIIADVDDLKKTNDYFGHAVGDVLLYRTAQALMSSFRVEDVVARIGGDEFAVLLPRTSEVTAQNAIYRFKEIIQGLNSNSNDIPIRLSIGVSTIQPNGSLKKGFILADENMYLDKQNKPSWSP